MTGMAPKRLSAYSVAMIKDRLQLQLILAALFGAGAVFSAIRHQWFDTALAAAVVVLALVAANRRRKTPNA